MQLSLDMHCRGSMTGGLPPQRAGAILSVFWETGNAPPRSGERPLPWRRSLAERLFLQGLRMQFPDRDRTVPVAEGDSALKNAPGIFIA